MGIPVGRIGMQRFPSPRVGQGNNFLPSIVRRLRRIRCRSLALFRSRFYSIGVITPPRSSEAFWLPLPPQPAIIAIVSMTATSFAILFFIILPFLSLRAASRYVCRDADIMLSARFLRPHSRRAESAGLFASPFPVWGFFSMLYGRYRYSMASSRTRATAYTPMDRIRLSMHTASSMPWGLPKGFSTFRPPGP